MAHHSNAMLNSFSIIAMAFLSTVLIAFGWMPCPICCTGGISTECCANIGIPETLFLTLTHVSGACTCLDGAVVTLTWDAVNSWWAGSTTVCTSRTFSVKFYCQSGGSFWIVDQHTGNQCWVTSTPTQTVSGTCSLPFSVTFSSAFAFTLGTAALCCPGTNGTYDGVVSE